MNGINEYNELMDLQNGIKMWNVSKKDKKINKKKGRRI